MHAVHVSLGFGGLGGCGAGGGGPPHPALTAAVSSVQRLLTCLHHRVPSISAAALAHARCSIKDMKVEKAANPALPKLNTISTMTFCTPQHRLAKFDTTARAFPVAVRSVIARSLSICSSVRQVFPEYTSAKLSPSDSISAFAPGWSRL